MQVLATSRFFRFSAALVLSLASLLAPANGEPSPAPTGIPVDGVAEAGPYAWREDVLRFADEVAERRGLDPDWLKASLAQARFVPAAVRLIMPPPAGTAKNWIAYRSRFIEPKRIQAGVEFWDDNAAWLERAEQRYGVPPEIVVGIIGVETLYGQYMGGFRVLDALATLAFDFPSGRSDRSGFFRDELENYLLLCRRERVDPVTWSGSYAGAVGLPQFMPSSILRDAVDFDGDGRIDLHTSPGDVIGSVANFLANAGWQRGLATHFAVAVPVDSRARATLLGPDILPLFNPGEFVELGALLPDEAMAVESKLALVELQNGDAAPSYVAGTTNFYAVTRYNQSSYYAMAVIELGTAVKRQRMPLDRLKEAVPAGKP